MTVGFRLFSGTRDAASTAGLAAVLFAFSFHSAIAYPAQRISSEPTIAAEIPENPEFEPVRLSGPYELPWAIAALPDGSLLLTERPGRLTLLRPGGNGREIGDARGVTGVPAVFTDGEQGAAGLLDVAVDPRFAENGFVYLSYVHGAPERTVLRVLRARLDIKTAALADGAIVYESREGPVPELFGGRVAVSRDGHLFVGNGDRWRREWAQDVANTAGSIVRVRTDGAIPLDNPFADTPGARPELWTLGHRNPLGLALDDEGRLWAHENGPQGGDELNLIEPGRNYGWPVISHGREYEKPPAKERKGPSTIEGQAKDGMEPPVHHWTPAVAPSGMAIERIPGGHAIWIGGLAGRAVIRLEVQDGKVVKEERHLHDELGRIRDVTIGPDGVVYVLTDGANGAIYRLDPVIEQAGRPVPRSRRM